MKTSPWLRWLIAAMALFALVLFAACGDDDDDDGGDSNGDATATPADDTDQPDDDDDDDDSGSGGGSDEEEYVADICSAMDDFGNELTAILTNPENTEKSEEEALELFEEPFENLANALRDADPPGDVDEFHQALVDNMDDVLEKIRDGDIAALEEIGSVELPTPSADVQSKYEAIAEDNPDCAAADIFGQP